MREISIEANNETGEAPRLTFCAYGPTRSGKTTFAGSFPRPAFLSDVTESGYTSLVGMSDEHLFEPGVQPIVLGIEKMNDMAVAQSVLEPFIRARMVQTIVVDSLTFYADLYLTYLFDLQGPNANNLKAYGALGQHLRSLRVKWHQMGCNVVWLCLPSDPNEDQPNGLPMIPGNERGKFGASCDYLLYLRHDRFKQGNEMTDRYEMHSQPFGKYLAGVRRSDGVPEIPSPLCGMTYAKLLQYMGYDPDATRAVLPAYVRPKIVIPSAPTPPVASTSAAPAASNPKPPAPVKPSAAALARPAARPAVPTNSPNVSRRPAVPAGRGTNS